MFLPLSASNICYLPPDSHAPGWIRIESASVWKKMGIWMFWVRRALAFAWGLYRRQGRENVRE